MIEPADVTLTAVTKRYGSVVAVDAINLTIPQGTYCCLLGPSGCGKTTTLRMIAGHEQVSDGEIMLGRQTVNDLPPARRRTAMMFQNYALFPHLKCLDNIAFSLKVRGVGKVERRQQAYDMLRLVQMEAFAERLPSQLSGGQQQRVALARALMTHPSVLYTLFMVIPIFNSMMRIDRSLLAAAADCGASDGQVLRDEIIPLSKPGIAIGSIFVVTLVMGDFITVRLMSGGQSASVGLMMMNQIALLQYPAAAANAVILLIVTLLIVMAMVRIVDIRKEL